ncbi:MAG: hypothetical protein LBP53_00475 [Candidatus Peribacteria bacterium]|jgi:hypothetical protein|nr:hypothetical protein [Candidatus Peribacteria bacterium]
MYTSPYHKSYKKSRTLSEHFEIFLQKIPFLRSIVFTKEVLLISFFLFLFMIIIVRLFYFQVIQHTMYDTKLNAQHTRSTSVKANRGNIYAMDKSGQPVKLTENLSLYDVALDPTLVGNTTGGVSLKGRLIELLTPIVYKHLCIINGMDQVSPEKCVQNVENFTNTELLLKPPQLFYYGSGVKSPEYDTFDFSGFDEKRIQIISGFTETKAMELITQRLTEKIQI